MNDFNLGECVLMEIAVAKYAEDLDISLFAAQQLQEIVMKLEMNIKKLNAAAAPMTLHPIDEKENLNPST